MFLKVSDLCRNSNRAKTAVSSRSLLGGFNEQAGGACSNLVRGWSACKQPSELHAPRSEHRAARRDRRPRLLARVLSEAR